MPAEQEKLEARWPARLETERKARETVPLSQKEIDKAIMRERAAAPAAPPKEGG